MILDDQADATNSFALPPKAKDRLEPDNNPAADLARRKIESLYTKEPSVKTELDDLKEHIKKNSKHQQYLRDVSSSGRSLAEIQTAWHNYYAGLPDKEKHEVWQEFYALHGGGRYFSLQPNSGTRTQADQMSSQQTSLTQKILTAKRPTVADVKKHLISTLSSHGQLKARHHIKSLIVGLASGFMVILILLFGFFNERFIAPLISPSRSVSSTPIIIDPTATTVADKSSKIIIPKINVEAPVVYDEPSIDEKAIQKSLERGVLHYGNSPSPGEQGNAVIVGHSSNNILNLGKYKFAFVLLNRLEKDDTFMLTKDGKRYVYKVYERKIVEANDISVMGPTDKPATVTLITCDPPGTSWHRLVIIGEQITPDPKTNLANSIKPDAQQPKIIPSNAPSLWQRIKDWFTS